MRARHGYVAIGLIVGLGACEGTPVATTHTLPPDAGASGRDAGSIDAHAHDARDERDASTDAGTIDPTAWSVAPVSCAFACPAPDPPCPEATKPYSCQNLGAWPAIPHAATCAAWDGKYPTPVAGTCTATLPTGNAARYTGVDPANATVYVLPDGHAVEPFGQTWVFTSPDLEGGLTTGIVPVAGTSYVLTIDTGLGDHAVRVVDTTRIGQGNPVVGSVTFPAPAVLNSSAVFIPPDLVYVAMDGGVLQAMSLDTATGALAIDDTRNVMLPAATNPNSASKTWYAASLALSPDQRHMLVSPVFEGSLLVVDVDPASPRVRQIVGQVDLQGGSDNDTFQVAFDPNDTTGHYAYVTMWADKQVLAIDVSTPTAPVLVSTWATDKAPQGLAFPDAQWMVVANDLGDSFTLVDRIAGTTSVVPVDAPSSLPGFEPSTLAYDPTSQRLYVTLAGMNAIEAWAVDLSSSPPVLTPAGRLPTSWWPGGLTVLPGGALAVVTLRGLGSGPSTTPESIVAVANGIASGVGSDMRGAVQLMPAPTAADLAAEDAIVAQSLAVGAQTGAPTVECPTGVYDFPVPSTNTTGPSTQIQHVFFIVRENKDFDGVLGDLPGVNGDPSLTLEATTAQMDELWPNTRALVKAFALSDNYYTDAIYSTQGHTWTMYGRTDDFNERTWAVSGPGRSSRAIPGIGLPAWAPEEGSLFDWLDANHVAWNEWGELVGLPQNPDDMYLDFQFPGGTLQNLRYSDTERACYLAGRLRVRCDLGTFEYICQPNDHTFGVAADVATPESCVATNDEATGLLVDAITHSPEWATSLVVLVEDDASQGGEHVDQERTIFLLISPWVKRGYVSHTHIDGSSVHKLFAHVLGAPYENALVAGGSLPFDMFTSTPDYTPYTYVPRKWPLECGTPAMMMQVVKHEPRAAADDVDEDPSLDREVTEWMRARSAASAPPSARRLPRPAPQSRGDAAEKDD